MLQKSHLRIMCVEDDINLRFNLSDIMRTEGYTVRDFADGSDAMDFLRTIGEGALPHLIILDINMPQMNGLEFVRRMHAMGGRYEKIPVIMLTAMVQESYKLKASVLGIHDYLVKPIDWDFLLGRVASHLGLA